MKLLIVAAVKDFEAEIIKILKQCNVGIFSITNVTGYKNMNDDNLLNDWFASSESGVDSLFAFCFTKDDAIQVCKQAIATFNQQQLDAYPIKAFVLNTENLI